MLVGGREKLIAMTEWWIISAFVYLQCNGIYSQGIRMKMRAEVQNFSILILKLDRVL